MLPSGWELTIFDKHIDLLSGFPFKSAEYSNNEKDICLLRGDNIEPNHLRWRNVKRWNCTEYDNLKKFHLRKGDFVIAMDRTWVSSGLKVAEVQQSDLPCLLVQRVSRIRSKNTLIQELLKQYFSSFKFEQYVKSVQTETAVPHISAKQIKEFPLLLPPLPEQRKIAQILSSWDKAISATESLIANSQQQKKFLMQQLLTGKKRFEGFKEKFSVRDGFAKKKLGFLPDDWKVDLICNYFWYQEGPGVRKHQFVENGIKLFNGTNIQKSRVVINNTKTCISPEEAYGAYSHFMADQGDLVIACSGISVDKFDEKIAFLDYSHLPLCMNTSTMRFKVIDENIANINFFRYFMMSHLFKDQIRRQITGSAQLNFGPSHVGNCFIVLPSLEEQQKIASILTAADQEIDTLQQKLTHLKQEKKALMQQLLTGNRRVKVDNETEAA